MKPFQTAQDALKQALSEMEEEASILVMPAGDATLSILTDTGLGLQQKGSE